MDKNYRCGNRSDFGCFCVMRVRSDAQDRQQDHRDTVQVLVNGKYYLTHYTNVVLVADPEQGALSYSDVTYGWDGINE